MQRLPLDILVAFARYLSFQDSGAFALSFKRASVATREALHRTEELFARIEDLSDKDAELFQRRVSKGMRARKRRFEAELAEEFVGIRDRSMAGGLMCSRDGCTHHVTFPEDAIKLCELCLSLFGCGDCELIHRPGGDAPHNTQRCNSCGARVGHGCGVSHSDRNEGDHLICRNCIDDFCDGVL